MNQEKTQYKFKTDIDLNSLFLYEDLFTADDIQFLDVCTTGECLFVLVQYTPQFVTKGSIQKYIKKLVYIPVECVLFYKYYEQLQYLGNDLNLIRELCVKKIESQYQPLFDLPENEQFTFPQEVSVANFDPKVAMNVLKQLTQECSENQYYLKKLKIVERYDPKIQAVRGKQAVKTLKDKVSGYLDKLKAKNRIRENLDSAFQQKFDETKEKLEPLRSVFPSSLKISDITSIDLSYYMPNPIELQPFEKPQLLQAVWYMCAPVSNNKVIDLGALGTDDVIFANSHNQKYCTPPGAHFFEDKTSLNAYCVRQSRLVKNFKFLSVKQSEGYHWLCMKYCPYSPEELKQAMLASKKQLNQSSNKPKTEVAFHFKNPLIAHAIYYNKMVDNFALNSKRLSLCALSLFKQKQIKETMDDLINESLQLKDVKILDNFGQVFSHYPIYEVDFIDKSYKLRVLEEGQKEPQILRVELENKDEKPLHIFIAIYREITLMQQYGPWGVQFTFNVDGNKQTFVAGIKLVLNSFGQPVFPYRLLVLNQADTIEFTLNKELLAKAEELNFCGDWILHFFNVDRGQPDTVDFITPPQTQNQGESILQFRDSDEMVNSEMMLPQKRRAQFSQPLEVNDLSRVDSFFLSLKQSNADSKKKADKKSQAKKDKKPEENGQEKADKKIRTDEELLISNTERKRRQKLRQDKKNQLGVSASFSNVQIQPSLKPKKQPAQQKEKKADPPKQVQEKHEEEKKEKSAEHPKKDQELIHEENDDNHERDLEEKKDDQPKKQPKPAENPSAEKDGKDPNEKVNGDKKVKHRKLKQILKVEVFLLAEDTETVYSNPFLYAFLQMLVKFRGEPKINDLTTSKNFYEMMEVNPIKSIQDRVMVEKAKKLMLKKQDNFLLQFTLKMQSRESYIQKLPPPNNLNFSSETSIFSYVQDLLKYANLLSESGGLTVMQGYQNLLKLIRAIDCEKGLVTHGMENFIRNFNQVGIDNLTEQRHLSYNLLEQKQRALESLFCIASGIINFVQIFPMLLTLYSSENDLTEPLFMATVQGSYEIILMKDNLLTGTETKEVIATFIAETQLGRFRKNKHEIVKTKIHQQQEDRRQQFLSRYLHVINDRLRAQFKTKFPQEDEEIQHFGVHEVATLRTFAELFFRIFNYMIQGRKSKMYDYSNKTSLVLNHNKNVKIQHSHIAPSKRVKCQKYDFFGKAETENFYEEGEIKSKFKVDFLSGLDQAMVWILNREIYLPVSFISEQCYDNQRTIKPEFISQLFIVQLPSKGSHYSQNSDIIEETPSQIMKNNINRSEGSRVSFLSNNFHLNSSNSFMHRPSMQSLHQNDSRVSMQGYPSMIRAQNYDKPKDLKKLQSPSATKSNPIIVQDEVSENPKQQHAQPLGSQLDNIEQEKDNSSSESHDDEIENRNINENNVLQREGGSEIEKKLQEEIKNLPDYQSNDENEGGEKDDDDNFSQTQTEDVAGSTDQDTYTGDDKQMKLRITQKKSVLPEISEEDDGEDQSTLNRQDTQKEKSVENRENGESINDEQGTTQNKNRQKSNNKKTLTANPKKGTKKQGGSSGPSLTIKQVQQNPPTSQSGKKLLSPQIFSQENMSKILATHSQTPIPLQKLNPQNPQFTNPTYAQGLTSPPLQHMTDDDPLGYFKNQSGEDINKVFKHVAKIDQKLKGNKVDGKYLELVDDDDEQP